MTRWHIHLCSYCVAFGIVLRVYEVGAFIKSLPLARGSRNHQEGGLKVNVFKKPGLKRK